MGGNGVELRRVSLAVAYGWLWPGFPRLWSAGQWQGLAWATAFAAALNVTIIGSMVYSELLVGGAAWGAWLAVGLFWFVGFVVNRRWQRQYNLARAEVETDQDLFPQALNEYLQGNWFAVEAGCRSLIRRRPDDADARLLLVAALRRAGNLTEARRELELLEAYESACKWPIEIEQERQLLKEAEEEAREGEPDEPEQTEAEPIRRAA